MAEKVFPITILNHDEKAVLHEAFQVFEDHVSTNSDVYDAEEHDEIIDAMDSIERKLGI